ncbi:MAG TPA: hypothetical protein VGF14_01120 [Alphaproteobacteria bacterium]
MTQQTPESPIDQLIAQCQPYPKPYRLMYSEALRMFEIGPEHVYASKKIYHFQPGADGLAMTINTDNLTLFDINRNLKLTLTLDEYQRKNMPPREATYIRQIYFRCNKTGLEPHKEGIERFPAAILVKRKKKPSELVT